MRKLRLLNLLAPLPKPRLILHTSRPQMTLNKPPRRIAFRDIEGLKLIPQHHRHDFVPSLSFQERNENFIGIGGGPLVSKLVVDVDDISEVHSDERHA